MSPKKKRPKMETSLKRPIEAENNETPKQIKIEKKERDIQAMKRKNFVKACEQVSYKAYGDYNSRFLLDHLPESMITAVSKNHNSNKIVTLRAIPEYAERSFKIELQANMWCEALEVCHMCITPNQYLSETVLKDIVEIILNASETSSEYVIQDLIYQCQLVLSKNFIAHPPCLMKSLNTCYKNFLTSPMDLRDETFTNRADFGHEKGIVKYCMNRLEYEVSIESKDEPLVSKSDVTPEIMKQSVQGLHWQTQKLEIFEVLKRSDRIQRLMAILESIVELLQYDLALWNMRYTHNTVSRIMSSNKPLIAYVLWTNNVLYTGAINQNCRQILKLFVHFVLLEYPEQYIKIMTKWFNTVVQAFYFCESNSHCDYPNIGKYCTTFAKDFYNIISEYPSDSIIKILERIQPTCMQYLTGTLHIQTLLKTKEDNILKIFITFLKERQWTQFTEGIKEIKVSNVPSFKPKKVKCVTKYLMKICKSLEKTNSAEFEKELTCAKYDSKCFNQVTSYEQNDVVNAIFISLKAYLDVYSVQYHQEMLDSLNEQLQLSDNDMEMNADSLGHSSSYIVTETFVKKYRTIYETLKDIILMLEDMKETELLPEALKVFENIGILGLC